MLILLLKLLLIGFRLLYNQTRFSLGRIIKSSLVSVNIIQRDNLNNF